MVLYGLREEVAVVDSHIQRFVLATEETTVVQPVAPVAQRYRVTSDTLGREFDPGKRDFSH